MPSGLAEALARRATMRFGPMPAVTTRPVLSLTRARSLAMGIRGSP